MRLLVIALAAWAVLATIASFRVDPGPCKSHITYYGECVPESQVSVGRGGVNT